jgi:ABC-2 type transport system ATP-binding protein
VADVPVLFLDEPTTGLDPRSRTELWAVIRELVDSGRTLLLTTQYLEEADQLADDIVVIDHGRAIARGSADELKSAVGGERIELTLAPETSVDAARGVLTGFSTGDVHVDERSLAAPIAGGAQTLTEALRALDHAGVELRDVGLRRPSLDDVFLALTGQVVGGTDTSDADTDTNDLEQVA